MTKWTWVGVSVLLALQMPALAIPYQTTTEATQEAPPDEESSGNWDLNWDYIYQFRKSTASAVHPYWLLTAAHVADDPDSGTIVIGSTTYTVQETRYYDGTATGSTNAADATRDLALVRFDHAFPGYYSYATGTSYNHDDVIFVGYGRSGTVTQTTTSGYWTDSGTGQDKRWGTNNIDGSASRTDSYGTYLFFQTSISGTLDSRNTDYETGLNVYDSGSPLFVYDGDEWIITGINTGRGGDPLSATYSVRVGDYDAWIKNVAVPEPATVGLLLCGGIALLGRRRRGA